MRRPSCQERSEAEQVDDPFHLGLLEYAGTVGVGDALILAFAFREQAFGDLAGAGKPHDARVVATVGVNHLTGR